VQVRERFEGGTLTAWRGKRPALRPLPKPAKAAARIFFVDIPGSAQSQISLAHFGPLRNAPDYLPTSVMASILGGGFTSRINMNLREDKGYSYGARAGFNYSRQYGVLVAGASVRSDATYQSLLELHNDLNALQTGKSPPTDPEFTRERASVVLGLPSRFATAGAALGQFRSLAYYGLPLDYWSSFTAKMQKVSLSQVAAAARKHLRSDDAVYVVVGDANAPMIVRDGKQDVALMKDGNPVTLRGALEQLATEGVLGKGGLRVLDADGKPIP
jgi:zinc protease